ncbi:DUF4064 domain-containing protein [Blastococcus haudaquaticus]|uniref:Uncharacterized protein n=1 Tax=Blastococcus haudaquaticus TaxID=1938745 RepID=A0A286H4J9_9ACTN|nr:DUF4064 domain-containing protein [Blastococcus haudaquaticus]SOE02715.1 hypothetical protein SAMN06272739_3684 [Blastococcus haudaquaticus]
MTSGYGGPGSSPWADPATPTEPGLPYAGPPQTAPQQYATQQYPAQPYAGQPYGQPPAYGYPAQPWGAPAWGPAAYGYPLPPRPPQRPGQLITAAVLAFAQSLVVIIASVYLWFFASIADVAVAATDELPSSTLDSLATEGTALAIVQLISAVLLIGAGVWALNSRRRAAGLLLLAALAVQVVLAVYWAVRLNSEIGGYDTEGTITALALFFAAGPLVGLGMLLFGPGRRWFDGVVPPSGQV